MLTRQPGAPGAPALFGGRHGNRIGLRTGASRAMGHPAVGWSLAASALSKAARAVLATASLPLTSMRTISSASGTESGSAIDDSLAYSRYVPGA
ncbi:hypothetical protein AZ18_2998 [Bordetella bronchiseptica D993]|nr:hypothetical protein AZ18_2998 [Bordetella bronchiseptica D993]